MNTALEVSRWKYVGLFLLISVGLAGCQLFSDVSVDGQDVTDVPESFLVTNPESARDVALAYIRTFHPGTGPAQEAIWFDATENAASQGGTSNYKYRYESWLVWVAFPEDDPEDIVYSVIVERPSPEFSWRGLVDAYGQVVETAFRQQVSTVTRAPATATPTESVPPTETPSPSGTPTQTATPSVTPPATATFTATPIPEPCNAVEFLEDVTIQDGTNFTQGADFTKIWRFKNIGTCTWTRDYDLVFVDGNPMGADPFQVLSENVQPGEIVELSLDLEAPNEIGDYQGSWMLRDSGGVLFGLGNQADQPFWVIISVSDFNERDYEFDLALDYCAASWWSEAGRLPCPGFVDSADGFVNLLSTADLEIRREDEATLWVHPNEERDGWIEGVYPTYKVEEGDHFRAWVGCLKGYPRCNLTFYLDYEDRDEKIHSLGEWEETSDGEVTKINIDLSDLAGERIRLILGAEANTRNSQDMHGFWFVPRVE